MGNSPRVAQNHYLTVTEEHFQFAVSDDLLTGDKLGMQTPAGGRTAAHEKTRVVINARENMSFSEIVDVLENTLVAEEGLELVVVFAGKTYILSAAGDKLGIISAREKR